MGVRTGNRVEELLWLCRSACAGLHVQEVDEVHRHNLHVTTGYNVGGFGCKWLKESEFCHTHRMHAKNQNASFDF